jgi:hypothetical protein
MVEKLREERPERVPFGGFQQRLEVKNKDPNYWYYWHLDRGDNIERAVRAGYEFVNPRDAGRYLPAELTDRSVNGGNRALTDRIEVYGGRDEYGREFRHVLMRQPMEFHLQDMAAEDAKADAVETAIQRQTKDANRYGELNVSVKQEE